MIISEAIPAPVIQDSQHNDNKTRNYPDLKALLPTLRPGIIQNVQNPIVTAFDRALSNQGLNVDAPKKEFHYSPQAIAKQVLNTVNKNILQAMQSEGRHHAQDVFSKANHALQNGLSELLDQYGGYGKNTGQGALALDGVASLLKNGMQALEQQAGLADQPMDAITASIEHTKSMTVSRHENISIQIETEEGDIVTLHINKNRDAEFERHAQISESGIQLEQRRSINANAGLEYQVDGELSEEEQHAIDKLIGKVGSLAKEFFKGDIKSAFEKSKSLGIDNDNIANFSAKFSLNETRKSVQTYKQVGQLNDLPNAMPAKDSKGDLAQLAQFMRNADETARDLKNTPFFKDPQQVLKDTLAGMLKLLPDNDQEMNELNRQAEKSLEQVAHQLISLVGDYIQAPSTDKPHNSDPVIAPQDDVVTTADQDEDIAKSKSEQS